MENNNVILLSIIIIFSILSTKICRAMYLLFQLVFGDWKIDCYVNCYKEEWTKEISFKFDTTYHVDCVFQKMVIIFG